MTSPVPVTQSFQHLRVIPQSLLFVCLKAFLQVSVLSKFSEKACCTLAKEPCDTVTEPRPVVSRFKPSLIASTTAAEYMQLIFCVELDCLTCCIDDPPLLFSAWRSRWVNHNRRVTRRVCIAIAASFSALALHCSLNV
jgi:hypothetical protein